MSNMAYIGFGAYPLSYPMKCGYNRTTVRKIIVILVIV